MRISTRHPITNNNLVVSVKGFIFICLFFLIENVSGSSSSKLIHLLETSNLGRSSSSTSTTASTTQQSNLQLQGIPNQLTTSNGIVTIITSPGTPMSFASSASSIIDSSLLSSQDDEKILSLIDSETDNKSTIQLICRGSTLGGTNDLERLSLAFCSIVSNVVVLTGITLGDIDTSSSSSSLTSSSMTQSSFRQSRHSRTVTVLFRAKINSYQSQQQQQQSSEKDDVDPIRQTLILVIDHDTTTNDTTVDENQLKSMVQNEIVSLYQAAAVEKVNAPTFETLYDLRIIMTTQLDKALSLASEAASASASSSSPTLASQLFASTWTTVRGDYETSVATSGGGGGGETAVPSASSSSDVSSSLFVGLDPPHIAQAFVTVMNTHAKYTRMVRNKVMNWKSRTARGLLIDNYTYEATLLRLRCLTNGYDTETSSASGLPQVAQYRLELRNQLQNMIDDSIIEVYQQQINNVQTSAVKKFQKLLLKNLANQRGKNTYESNEAYINSNNAILRQQSFNVDTTLSYLEVPVLNLYKEPAVRTITSALNETLIQFPDSPMAKLQRSNLVKQIITKETTNKKKKPNQPAFGLGLDFIMMFRPDGFGSLQGFAGYTLPGGSNTITVGVHNDADDPQVIAQFGGVRPPLLRVQPKLRLDVEL